MILIKTEQEQIPKQMWYGNIDQLCKTIKSSSFLQKLDITEKPSFEEIFTTYGNIQENNSGICEIIYKSFLLEDDVVFSIKYYLLHLNNIDNEQNYLSSVLSPLCNKINGITIVCKTKKIKQNDEIYINMSVDELIGLLEKKRNHEGILINQDKIAKQITIDNNFKCYDTIIPINNNKIIELEINTETEYFMIIKFENNIYIFRLLNKKTLISFNLSHFNVLKSHFNTFIS